MQVRNPTNNRIEFYHYTDPAFAYVERGTKLRCGAAWYLHPDEVVRHFGDFYKLKAVYVERSA